MKVTRKVEELQARGVDILGFGAGEPDFPSPSSAIEAAHQALDAGFTRYTPAAGSVDLREALLDAYRSRWGAPWSELAESVVTVGAKAALFELAQALVGRGDEVLVPTPCWVTFPEQVRLAGAEPVFVEGDPGDGFAFHADRLVAAFTPRTRAVVLNSPCNPTGAVLERGELERLVDACAENDVVLIADETYERFVYDGEFTSAASFAERHPETVVVVSSFSKTYAMTGWRVGYVLGPKELTTAVADIQSHATSNPTSFAMKGALAALAHAQRDVENMIAEFRRRRDYVVERLGRMAGVRCVEPRGAFYVFPEVADLYAEGEGSVELAERLLEEAHVGVVPGIAFGHDRHVRLSFTSSLDDLREGLDRMERALARPAQTWRHNA